MRVAEVRFAFGRTPILSDVTLSVRAGECVALLGSNGAGKSTLLRLCAGLLTPASGTIQFDGDPRSLAHRDSRRRIGLVFQRHQLVPQSTVLSNVVHGRLGFPEGWRCWCHPFAPARVRTRAMSCLAAVGLADKAMQRAGSLSGGESQRVAIARTLIRDPDLILADEPTASLDPAAGDEVLELLRQLNRERGVTTVVATHDVERALTFADRIVGIHSGKVLFDSPAADLTPERLSVLYRPGVVASIAERSA